MPKIAAGDSFTTRFDQAIYLSTILVFIEEIYFKLIFQVEIMTAFMI